MKKNNSVAAIFISIGLIITSCSSPQYFASKPAKEINDIQLFTPFANMQIIESGNTGIYDYTLSKQTAISFQEALQSATYIPITNTIFDVDSATNKKLENETIFLCLTAKNKIKKMDKIDLTAIPTIDSILKANRKRFGLISVLSGFERTSSNYSAQVTKGIITGILTLGMFYTVPYKSSLSANIVIVDAQENNIAFFRTLNKRDKTDDMENFVRSAFYYFHKINE